MTVEDLARTDPIAATPGASIAQVSALMRDENVGSVVIQDDGKPVGLVTDRDVAIRVTAEGEDPTDITAADVMTPDPVVVDRETGVMALTRTMAEHAVRRIPIVDDGQLYGIVTLDDLDRLLTDERQHLSQVIAEESPPY
jgi:CBS domain-containing protein